MSKLGTATVHSNGTARRELEDQFRANHEAVTAAINVIAGNYPHKRDFYVQDNGNESFDAAEAKHRARIEKLQAINAEIYADYEAFAEAN